MQIENLPRIYLVMAKLQTQALRAWLWSLAVKELGRSVKHSGMELLSGPGGLGEQEIEMI